MWLNFLNSSEYNKNFQTIFSVQFSCSVTSMDCSTPGLSVHRQLPEFTQTHVHWVGDAIQPSRPLSSPSPPAFNLFQHQGLFKWVSYLYQVDKLFEFQQFFRMWLTWGGRIWAVDRLAEVCIIYSIHEFGKLLNQTYFQIVSYFQTGKKKKNC